MEFDPCNMPEIVFSLLRLAAQAHHDPSINPVPKVMAAKATRTIPKGGCTAMTRAPRMCNAGAISATPLWPHV